jgi:hypothetical protein
MFFATSAGPDSLLVLTDPTNGDLIQTGVVAESTSGGGGALREPDVAHIVTRLMGRDSPLANINKEVAPLPSGNMFSRPTSIVITVLDGVGKDSAERVSLPSASGKQHKYALQRSRVGTLEKGSSSIVPSLLFDDTVSSSSSSMMFVCGAADTSDACSTYEGTAASVGTTQSFDAALIDGTAPLRATFGETFAVVGNDAASRLTLRSSGVALDMSDPKQRFVMDELLQLAVMADTVREHRDAKSGLFVIHLSALSALQGDAAFDAAEAFTAALLPLVVTKWNGIGTTLSKRPIDMLLLLAAPTALSATGSSETALQEAYASLAEHHLLRPTTRNYADFRAKLPIVERSDDELPQPTQDARCGAQLAYPGLFVYCSPRATRADAASGGEVVVEARRRLLQTSIAAVEFVPQGKNYTLTEIEDYQITLWASVGLICAVGAAIFLLTTIDPGVDPSGMFSKFDVSDSGLKME